MARLAAFLAVAARVAAQTVPATTVTTDTRACQGAFASLPFCDTSKSIDERVADLVSRFQPSEVVPQITARHEGGGCSHCGTANVSRLGLPDYDWGLNCIHGVQSSCVKDTDGTVYCPTSFPNPVNYGFMWNQTAFWALGAVIANETRALWLAGAVEASTWSGRPRIGLDVWSPNININRDPRWGRNQEVPSEDPFLNGRYGTLHTQGLQEGVDPRYLPTVVTLKHWDAYSLDDSDGFTRDNFNAIVSNFSLADTYWPAFKASVIEGNAAGVMCSYNAVNGVPTCASSFLTQSILRGTWGFNGYITSDTGAVEDIWNAHHYAKDGPHGACAAIKDGTTDVCSGTTYHDHLLDAVNQGICSMDDVNAALARTLSVRMRLGLFDPIDNQPYWHMGLKDFIGRPEALEAQWIATLEGQVLLKNDGTLPLAPGKRVAVIGPHAMADLDMAGNYLGQLCPDNTYSCIDTPLKVISSTNSAGKTLYAAGSPLTRNDTSGFPAAVAIAKQSDVVVLFLGIDGSVEGEMNDRPNITLPYVQQQLLSAILAATVPAKTPVIVVLFNGGTLDISYMLSNPAVNGVLEAGYPGVLGGHGVAATLFGTNDRLGGKLPYTMYPQSYCSDIKMSEMELDVGPGRGYRYYTGTPVLPFGYGLSYTTFSIVNTSTTLSYTPMTPSTAGGAGEGNRAVSAVSGKPLLGRTRSLDLPRTTVLAPGQAAVLKTEPAGWAVRKVGQAARPPAHGLTLSYSVNVTNTGSVTGDEVVQAYFYPSNATATRAGGNALIKQLWNFQRVHLAPGQTQTVSFTADAGTFRMTDRASGDRMSIPGTYRVEITNGVDMHHWYEVTLEGEQTVVEPFPGK